MKIIVNDTYAIGADVNSWFISKAHKRNESVTYEAVRWYATLDQTVHALVDLMVRKSDVETLADLLVEYEKAVSTLSSRLPQGFRVVRDEDVPALLQNQAG